MCVSQRQREPIPEQGCVWCLQIFKLEMVELVFTGILVANIVRIRDRVIGLRALLPMNASQWKSMPTWKLFVCPSLYPEERTCTD